MRSVVGRNVVMRRVPVFSLQTTYGNIYESMYEETSLEINFIYLNEKHTYCIFETRCIISVSLFTKCLSLRNFTVLCSNNTQDLQKLIPQNFKYQPFPLEVNKHSSLLRPCEWYSCPFETLRMVQLSF
jgi:hypothetical protein